LDAVFDDFVIHSVVADIASEFVAELEEQEAAIIHEFIEEWCVDAV
jgi:hypothetical protein